MPIPRPEAETPAVEPKAEVAPSPVAKPESGNQTSGEKKPEPGGENQDEGTKPPPPPPPPPPIAEEDAAEHATCMAELKSAGADAKDLPRIDPKNGCGIARPITISRLSADVEIKPGATMRCETAIQLQRWARDAVQPSIKATMPGKTLVGLEQASGYVCRNRNGAADGKISEHAHGNAVDIAAFVFSDGSRLEIAPREKDSTIEGAVQRAAVASACLYFTTVLDPGSDAAHETHLHLDVIKRKNGYRYCW